MAHQNGLAVTLTWTRVRIMAFFPGAPPPPDEYKARLRKLFYRWDPRGLFLSKEQCAAALSRLEAPPSIASKPSEIEQPHRALVTK